jgi:hypothetical protein
MERNDFIERTVKEDKDKEDKRDKLEKSTEYMEAKKEAFDELSKTIDVIYKKDNLGKRYSSKQPILFLGGESFDCLELKEQKQLKKWIRRRIENINIDKEFIFDDGRDNELSNYIREVVNNLNKRKAYGKKIDVAEFLTKSMINETYDDNKIKLNISYNDATTTVVNINPKAKDFYDCVETFNELSKNKKVKAYSILEDSFSDDMVSQLSKNIKARIEVYNSESRTSKMFYSVYKPKIVEELDITEFDVYDLKIEEVAATTMQKAHTKQKSINQDNIDIIK